VRHRCVLNRGVTRPFVRVFMLFQGHRTSIRSFSLKATVAAKIRPMIFKPLARMNPWLGMDHRDEILKDSGEKCTDSDPKRIVDEKPLIVNWPQNGAPGSRSPELPSPIHGPD
jgi:hypothetical protein